MITGGLNYSNKDHLNLYKYYLWEYIVTWSWICDYDIHKIRNHHHELKKQFHQLWLPIHLMIGIRFKGQNAIPVWPSWFITEFLSLYSWIFWKFWDWDFEHLILWSITKIGLGKKYWNCTLKRSSWSKNK